jgi:hypothetical protein
MIAESEMTDNILDAYDNLSKDEFVEEYNKLLDTNLTIDDVDWGN